MNKIKKNTILSFVGAVCIALITIPTSAYIKYKSHTNTDNNMRNSTSTSVTPKRVLSSIEATLKDEVKFYANNLARITNDDVIVVAHYFNDKIEETEIVESNKFMLSSPSDFYLNGGKITVSYLGKTSSFDVKLIKVEAESIFVRKKPYQINYQVNSFFNANGMEIAVNYNDGSTSVLDKSDYILNDSKPLLIDDKLINISYNNGIKVLTTSVSINVVEHLNNGSVVALDIDGNAIAYANDKLSNTNVKVLKVYENGNKELLDKSQYIIEGSNEYALLGEKQTINIKWGESKLEVPVVTRYHIECEDTNIVGGRIVDEPEYLFSGGIFTKIDNVKSAGGFGESVKDGEEAYINFEIESYTDCTSDITMRSGNSYLIKENNDYYMKPLQINTIMDLYINDTLVAIPNNCILKGCGPSKEYAQLYGVYSEFELKNIKLNAGINNIKLKFKQSSEGALTTWDESPSTMNLDYINIDTLGKERLNENVKEIKISKMPNLKFGDKLSDLNFSVIGIMEDNSSILLTKDQYDVSFDSFKKYVGIGNEKITITYKLNNAIKTEENVVVSDLKLEGEDGLLLGNDKVVTKESDEYSCKNGVYSSIGKITSIHGMDNSATAGYETSVSFRFNAMKGNYSFKAKLSNANYFIDENNMHYAKELSLNQVINLRVNGKIVDIDDVILPSISPTTNIDYIYLQFFEVSLANIQLIDGENTISIEADTNSSLRNVWNEIPIPRFDWFKISNK